MPSTFLLLRRKANAGNQHRKPQVLRGRARGRPNLFGYARELDARCNATYLRQHHKSDRGRHKQFQVRASKTLSGDDVF